jgi:CheY-like chemotaxis protein
MIDLDDDDADEEPTSPAIVLPRARILVVDDDATSRHVIAFKLRQDGYAVFEASSGDEALALLRTMHVLGKPTNDVDLLILDLHASGLAGVNVLRELRRQHSTIPTLVVTASPEPGLFTMAACLGARVMLAPVELERLSDAVIKLILAREPAHDAAAG